MIGIILIIAMALCAIRLIYSIRLLIRNERVGKFRIWVINNNFDLYYKLPSYEEMLRDGKPLKLESYFTKEEINP